MEGLGKEIGEGDGLDCVARGDERAQVAGQGCRVAGDVDQRGRGDLSEQRVISGAEAGARRVDDDQIGTADRSAVPASRRRKSRVAARTAVPVVPLRFSASAAIAAGADSTATTRAKLAVSLRAKRPTPAKRSQASSAVVAGGDPLDQRVHKPAIHLEKCAVVHAIVEAAAR